MKIDLLQSIVDTLNLYCKNYTASMPHAYCDYWEILDDHLIKTDSRVIRIQQRNEKKENKFWTIFEKDINKVIYKVSLRDSSFADRVATNTLSAYDVANIIRRCSFRIITLKMSSEPQSSNWD